MITELVNQRHQIEALCREYHVASLSVFGSAAGESFRAGQSDIDLVVEFREGLDAASYARAYFGLREALEELLGHPIDLVTRRSLINPYLAESVAKEEQPLYAA